MLTKSIIAAKTALTGSGRGSYPQGLVTLAGVRIFTAPEQIVTGYPHPDLIRQSPPPAGAPIVALYVRARRGDGLGRREHLLREDVVVAGPNTRKWDTYAYGELVLDGEIHILANSEDEVIGTAAAKGYIEQVLVIVRDHPDILGEQVGALATSHAQIRWDWADIPYEIPGAVTYAQDRRLYLGIVKTTFMGKLVGVTEVAAEVDRLHPYGDDFSPVFP
jgi:hypothetical protein